MMSVREIGRSLEQWQMGVKLRAWNYFDGNGIRERLNHPNSILD